MRFGKSLLLAFLCAMIPVLELRAAVFIPWAQMLAAGTAPTAANLLLIYVVTVLGNLLPVPFILLFIPKILSFLDRFRPFRPIVAWLRKKAEKHSGQVLRGAFIGLFTFVFLPVPGTGAWTGSLVAALFGMPRRRSFLVISLGVACCGILMNLICWLLLYQGVEWLRFFVKSV